MAVPRVFISSTYYDLKQYRSDLYSFVESLGYEAVMHDMGGVTYTQHDTLEHSCYNELLNCDIVVCIIGNRYGTESNDNDYSITMNEIKKAIKEQKKVYVYILKEVYTENEIYIANKGNNFAPRFADDVRVHDFILELKDTIKNHSIMPFENVNEITDNLKQQFAGLFQYYIRNEATTVNNRTYNDLKEVSSKISKMANMFEENQEMFFKKFDSTIFTNNYVIRVLSEKLGFKKSIFFARDREALEEMLVNIGFDMNYSSEDDEIYYENKLNSKVITIILKDGLFNADGTIKDIRSKEEVEELVLYYEKRCLEYDPFSDD